MKRYFAAVLGIFLVSATSASADKLPKGAVKVDASELRSLYAGKSSDWSRSRAYFAPDGAYYLLRKDKSLYGEGRWSVTGNKVCAKISWMKIKTKESGQHTDCWTFYKEGRSYWALYSGNKDQKTGWYNGELKKLSKGDKVSKAVLALKAQ